MSDLKKQVFDFIDQHNLVPDGSMIIVGFSGGADSLALLMLLADLRSARSFSLAAAHLHHGLRGCQADEDAAFVQKFCLERDIACHIQHRDVALLAREQKLGIEEAGRLARTAFFKELAAVYERQPSGPVRIALAHHRDDQAETLLLHLGRGCGLDGLAGMRPLADCGCIRPLLGQTHKQLEDWLCAGGTNWRQDTTNFQPVTIRNRLRLQVIPAWQDAIGFDPAAHLCQTADLLAGDQRLLQQLTDEHYGRIMQPPGLSRPDLLKLDPALQMRVLRRFWQSEVGGGQDLALVHLQNILSWLAAARSGQRLMLPRKRQICLQGQWLNLGAQSDPGAAGSDSESRDGRETTLLQNGIQLILPGQTVIPGLNMLIDALLIENESEIVYNDAMECFHLDKIRGCMLRSRRPGDRIHPASRQGSKSLKKYFNEIKIPATRRPHLPLLASGSQIIWIPGHASSFDHIARPGDGQKGQIICLSLKKPEQPNVSPDRNTGGCG